MKSNHRSLYKALILTVFLIGAGLLSACADAGQILPGSAGLATDVPTDAPATQTPAEAVIPPAVGHIVFVSNRDGQMSLYKASPDGVQQVRLTTEPAAEDISPVVSPDGTRVAFVSTIDKNMDIYILDLTTIAITRVTSTPERDASPTWSPDGTRLAFESFRDGNLEIYMANADGSNQVRLTNDPAGDSNPVWSPVSDEIAFVSNRFGNSDIILVTPNGQISPLTTSSVPDSTPAWSPDGSMIAYKTLDGELSNLCVINRDGLNQHCLTQGPSEYSSPVWSPDGLSIAATAKQSLGYGIDIFNVSDGNVTHLFSQGIDPLGTPSWSPEGVRLVFQAKSEGDMELYTVTVPTDEFTRITSIVAYDGEPAWTKQ